MFLSKEFQFVMLMKIDVCHGPIAMMSEICYHSNYNIDLKKVTSSGCHSIKVLSTAAGYFLVAVVTDLCCHLTIQVEHGIQCMPGSS